MIPGTRCERCRILREPWTISNFNIVESCACSDGSVSSSTFKPFGEREDKPRSVELCGPPTSLVCKAQETVQTQKVTRQSTLLRQKIQSLPLSMETGVRFSIQAVGSGACLAREYFPACQRETHLRALVSLAGRPGALKLVRGDAASLIMSPFLLPSP